MLTLPTEKISLSFGFFLFFFIFFFLSFELIIFWRLLKYPSVDPSDRENFAIKKAAEHGYHQIVKLLLGEEKEHQQKTWERAKKTKKREKNRTGKRIRKKSKKKTKEREYQRNEQSTKKWRWLNFCFLFSLDSCPTVDPAVDHNYPLQKACLKGSYETVVILLATNKVDPTLSNGFAFRSACSNPKNMKLVR